MNNKATQSIYSTSSLTQVLAFVLPFVFVLAFYSQNDCLAQGKLRRVSNAVRKTQPIKSKPKPPREEKPRDTHHDDDDDDRHGHQRESRRSNSRRGRHNHGSRNSGVIFFSAPQACAAPMVETIIEPVFVPVRSSSIVEEVVVQPLDQPFVQSHIQTLDRSTPNILADSIGGDWFYDTPSKFWATIGSDFDGIAAGGMGVNFQAPGSIGLDGSIMTLRESVDDYRDHLWIGDVNLMYEVLATGNVRGRIGVGINWLNDAWGAEAGLNLTGAVDVRLTQRLLLAAEGDVGNLGDADYFHGRVNFATRLDSCEWLLGMDHFNIGGAEVNNVFTGIQFRF